MVFLVIGLLLAAIVIIKMVVTKEEHWTQDVQEYLFVVSDEVAEMEEKFDKDFDKSLKKRQYIIADVNEAKMMGNKKCHRKGRKGTTLSDKRQQGRYAYDYVDLKSLERELVR